MLHVYICSRNFHSCDATADHPITGATGSLQQCIKAVDSNCDVIGTGAHHMITGAHLDQRHLVWKMEHEELVKYLPDDVTKPIRYNNENVCYIA